MSDRQRFAVIVPTWRRPSDLAVCLRALAAQRLPPARVLVVFKAGDTQTANLLAGGGEGWAGLTVVPVTVAAEGNFLTQLNAGIAATTEPLVALTDDDAEPRPDWLARMAEHFDDPAVAGVGGRDWQRHQPGDRLKVGTVSWFGRVVGNHHLGAGPPREVDLLKGVNWAFRGDLLRQAGVDRRLRGRATVMNTEVSVCLALRRQGGRLIYDPAVAVDHHVAPRQDGDVNTRGGFDARSFVDTVHNETLAVLDYLPPVGRAAFLVWALGCGTVVQPGLLQMPRLLWRRSPRLFSRWRATVLGRVAGIRTHLGGPPRFGSSDARVARPTAQTSGGGASVKGKRT